MTRKPLRRGRGRPKKEAPIEAAVIESLSNEFKEAVQLLREGKNAEAREAAEFSEYVWRRLTYGRLRR